MLVQHRAPSSTRSISTRICLWCGYDGEELQAINEVPAFVCPGCHEDLYARPPRSYAELELLTDEMRPRRMAIASVSTRLIAGPLKLVSWLGRLIRPQKW